MKKLQSQNGWFLFCFRSMGFLLILFLIFPPPGYAFSEDICYFYQNEGISSEKDQIVPLPFNCYDLECTDGLDADNQGAICTIKGLGTYLNAALLHNLHGRNALHFDVVWLAARAMGMRTEDADILAAYSQATDLGQYTHYDFLGKPMEQVGTENIAGVMRTNMSTNGFWLHYVPWFKTSEDMPKKISLRYNFEHGAGESPFGEWEVPLNHLRAWAFGQRRSVCEFGITDEFGNCYEEGSDTTLALSIPLVNPIRQTMPITLDWQRIKVCDPSSADSSCYEQDYAQKKKGSPEALGIYLHALDDRISHVLCSNASYIEKVDHSEYEYSLNYAFACGQITHIAMHYRETGHTPIPPRSVKAVLYSMLEIDDWIRTTGYVREYGAITEKEEMENLARKIASALTRQCAAERVKALCEVAKGYGLEWHDKNTTCNYRGVKCSDDS